MRAIPMRAETGDVPLRGALFAALESLRPAARRKPAKGSREAGDEALREIDRERCRAFARRSLEGPEGLASAHWARGLVMRP